MTLHCRNCTGYDEGLNDPIRGACPGVEDSPENHVSCGRVLARHVKYIATLERDLESWMQTADTTMGRAVKAERDLIAALAQIEELQQALQRMP